MRTENPNFSPLAWFGIVTAALWFWSSPLPSAFARKMYAAPLFEESAAAPTRTSAYVSPLSRPTETALPNWDPGVVWMIVRSGVFVPEPVKDEPLKRLIRPNVFGGVGAATVISPTIRSSRASLSIFPVAIDQPNRPFVLLNGARMRSAVEIGRAHV